LSRRAQKPLDFGECECLWQGALALRPFQHGCGIVGPVTFRIKKAIELANRREPPGRGGCFQAAPGKLFEIGPQISSPRCRDRTSYLFEISGQFFKIAPIGGKRVHSSATLGRQHIKI
jgi:hypothetical protein